MTQILTPHGYAQTKAKLAELERRLAELEGRTDLNSVHQAEVRHSYNTMIGQYRREIKLDRKSTRLNSSHIQKSRMPSSA